jgi:hypothetical protein
VSRGALWTARVLSALGVLFLLFDATIKVAMIQPVIDSAATLGVPVELMFPIGILELILLALYLIPSTSVLGVVLWTGFLGGSTLTAPSGDPFLTHVLFPSYIAAFLWGGLYLREGRLAPLRGNARLERLMAGG